MVEKRVSYPPNSITCMNSYRRSLCPLKHRHSRSNAMHNPHFPIFTQAQVQKWTFRWNSLIYAGKWIQTKTQLRNLLNRKQFENFANSILMHETTPNIGGHVIHNGFYLVKMVMTENGINWRSFAETVVAVEATKRNNVRCARLPRLNAIDGMSCVAMCKMDHNNVEHLGLLFWPGCENVVIKCMEWVSKN